jgi:hypothetical protein
MVVYTVLFTPSRFFVVYVVAVLAISAVKSVSVLRQLLPSTRNSLRLPKNGAEFLHAWMKCSNKIQSMKRMVVITLLLSLLVAAYRLQGDLKILAEESILGQVVSSGA